MSYLEELLPEFRKGAKIRQVDWSKGTYIHIVDNGIFDQGYHTFELEVEDFNSPFWELYKEPMGREITKKRRFSVYLNATADVSATITVNADNKEEAKKLAIDKVSTCDWDVDDVATSFIEVVYIGEEQDED